MDVFLVLFFIKFSAFVGVLPWVNIQIWRICSKGSGLMAVNLGVHFLNTNFQRPRAVKLYLESQNIFEVQEWYGPLYHHAKYGGAQT